MDDTTKSGFTILKTFIKGMKLNERYEPCLDIACVGKTELVNDIILEQSRNLTIKIIDSMNEELVQIFSDCNLNIVEFLISSRGQEYGIEIKIPEMAKIMFKRDVEGLVNSIRQQVIFYFDERKESKYLGDISNPWPPSASIPDAPVRH